LINNDNIDDAGIFPVLQITHYGIFDTDTVADCNYSGRQAERLLGVNMRDRTQLRALELADGNHSGIWAEDC